MWPAAVRCQTALEPIAIVDVSVIPMDSDRIARHQTVVIRGGRIEAVGPAFDVVIPAGARRIDGHDKYVIPGLADMHVHFVGKRSPSPAFTARLDRALARLYVASGVTSALSLCGYEPHVAFRDSIAQGLLVGPRLAVSGPCIDDSTMKTASGDSLARHDRRIGYDFLKVYTFLSRDGFRGLATAARELDMPVIGHIPIRVGLAGMLHAGAADIAHLEEIMYNAPFRLEYNDTTAGAVALDTNAIPRVVNALRRSGTYVTTTLIAYRSILDEAVDLDAVLADRCGSQMPREAQEFWQWDRAHNDRARRLSAPMPLSRLRLGWAFQQRLVKQLKDDGVPVLAGTDAPTLPGVGAGCSLHRELELLVAAGFTPFEALRTATTTPGEFFSRQFHWPESGTITPGARPDLVLLGRNPLADIRNVATVIGVVLNGRWLTSRDLGHAQLPRD
jgi:imidazolonepropionase-like amidohydrolase